MVTLARALGLRPLGQVVAGLAFGMSQYLVARAGFLSINAAAAWVPWVIWAGEQIVIPPSTVNRLSSLLRSLLLLSLFLACQLLAGHAQTTWYTLLLLGAWILWRTLIPFPVTIRATLARLLLVSFFFLPIFLAFGLAAAQLLPTAELLRESPRASAAEYEFVMTYSLSPWRWLTLFAPDLLGNPARGTFFGYGNYWEDAIYVGLLPLLLALGVVLSTLRRRTVALSRRHLVIFLGLLGVITTIIAHGRNTPVFPFLYQYIPTFNLFQAPTRWMLLFTFAAALLAGLGAEGWTIPQGRSLYWQRLGAAGAFAMGLVGLAAFWILPATTKLEQQFRTVALALALLGLMLFVSTLLALLKPSGPHHVVRWELGVAVFITIDLLIAGYGLNPGAGSELYRGPAETSAALRPALNGHRLYQFGEDEYAVKFSFLSFFSFGPPEWATATRAAQLPNAGMLDGIATAGNFDPLLAARYARFIEVVDRTQSLALLRLMDVGVLASEQPLEWETISQAEAVTRTVTFYRVPVEPQRVWVVYSAKTVVDSETALAALVAPDFDPSREVILEADDRPVIASGKLPASILTPSPNVITIPVSLSKSGWVILSDTYYPGWVAYVDDQPAPLLHANYAFRAVAVGPGDHRVTFSYQPRSFWMGVWASGFSGVVWLGLWLGYYWSSRRRTPL